MTGRQAIIDYLTQSESAADEPHVLKVDVEHFVIAGNGSPMTYNPTRDLPGVRDLLAYLSRWFDTERYNDRGDLIGLMRENCSISLEPAAQLRVSLAPQASVTRIEELYMTYRDCAGSFAKPFGSHLENGGYHPTSRAEDLPLVPKKLYRHMDEHFERIGTHGKRMIRGSAAMQVGVRYTSEADAIRKLRVAAALAPVLAAITDNMRTYEGRPNHVPIRRLALWRQVDDQRCGTVQLLFEEGFGFATYVDWLLDTPALEDSTATPKSPADIKRLIATFWPDARLSSFVEIRSADSPPAACVPGFAALVKGLFCSEVSLMSIEEALGVQADVWPLSPAAVDGAISAIQADGLDAEVYGKSLRWWENLLFSLARDALDGDERPYLETLARFAAKKEWWYVGEAKVVSPTTQSERHDRRIAAIREGYVAEDAFFMEHKRIFPRRAAVYGLISEIRALLFPGYFDDETPAGASSVALVGERLLRVGRILTEQVRRALLYDDWTLPDDEAQSRAERTAEEFLDELPRIQALILKDAEAAFEGDPAARSREEVILTYPGIYAILVHRIAHELIVRDVPLIPRLMSEEAHSKTGIDIAPGATIGEYFFIDHGTGVVIGETTVIGHHAKIYQGVTLGATSTRKGQQLAGVKRHPTLGDYVTVYSNASVLGGDTYIGSHSVIGGNAFVCESVPDNARVGVKDQSIVVRRMTR